MGRRGDAIPNLMPGSKVTNRMERSRSITGGEATLIRTELVVIAVDVPVWMLYLVIPDPVIAIYKLSELSVVMMDIFWLKTPAGTNKLVVIVDAISPVAESTAVTTTTPLSGRMNTKLLLGSTSKFLSKKTLGNVYGYVLVHSLFPSLSILVTVRNRDAD